MMSRNFRLRSELSAVMAKRLSLMLLSHLVLITVTASCMVAPRPSSTPASPEQCSQAYLQCLTYLLVIYFSYQPPLAAC